MATHEGQAYSINEGNMEMATEAQRKQIQAIFDLKNKAKLIHDEIEKRTQDLPQGKALVAPVTVEGEQQYYTVIAGKPKWIHQRIKENDLVFRNKTTKADKKDLGLE